MLSHLLFGFSTLPVGAGQSLYIGDMIYYIVLFLILMWLIKLVAWKPLNKMLKQRSDHITNSINSAEESQKKAKQLAAQRQKALDHSHDQATGIISDAKNSGQKQRSQIISSARDDAQSLKTTAQKNIEQEKRDALASTKNDVADLSIEIASKIIQKELKPKDQKTLIDSYIEGLGKHNAR